MKKILKGAVIVSIVLVVSFFWGGQASADPTEERIPTNREILWKTCQEPSQIEITGLKNEINNIDAVKDETIDRLKKKLEEVTDMTMVLNIRRVINILQQEPTSENIYMSIEILKNKLDNMKSARNPDMNAIIDTALAVDILQNEIALKNKLREMEDAKNRVTVREGYKRNLESEDVIVLSLNDIKAIQKGTYRGDPLEPGKQIIVQYGGGNIGYGSDYFNMADEYRYLPQGLKDKLNKYSEERSERISARIKNQFLDNIDYTLRHKQGLTKKQIEDLGGYEVIRKAVRERIKGMNTYEASKYIHGNEIIDDLTKPKEEPPSVDVGKGETESIIEDILSSYDCIGKAYVAAKTVDPNRKKLVIQATRKAGTTPDDFVRTMQLIAENPSYEKYIFCYSEWDDSIGGYVRKSPPTKKTEAIDFNDFVKSHAITQVAWEEGVPIITSNKDGEPPTSELLTEIARVTNSMSNEIKYNGVVYVVNESGVWATPTPTLDPTPTPTPEVTPGPTPTSKISPSKSTNNLAPVITGPSEGVVGRNYEFTAESKDATYLNFVFLGTDGKEHLAARWHDNLATQSYSWDKPGDYYVKIRAVNQNTGQVSNWVKKDIHISAAK